MATTSELIFPELATNFNLTLSNLKRATLSVHNRLRSILDDAEFAARVSGTFGLPLVANERCGSWYVPPHLKKGSAYFKSTDGHTGQWSFSNRRLNLQVLDMVSSENG
jgi:tRNA A64-2'-O-ribosylphosphate transferase